MADSFPPPVKCRICFANILGGVCGRNDPAEAERKEIMVLKKLARCGSYMAGYLFLLCQETAALSSGAELGFDV